ncbi:MAG: bifunctional DNA-formamidopyrimidine glycosylase/DNA-(apurinic or apyrimidinic site) lyase [Acidimicrobiales bacterium]|nr:bifunctional DNA-formamidopyrimidine glycosylase/DNA-(apurinic or apyrimidinic site) lyase [Acidimicrobiales bacterium]
MPELPEVETIRRELAPWLIGRTVAAADSHPSIKFTPAIEITGATIESVERRGKYLLCGTDDRRELVVHLGMTGSLLPDFPTDEPYVRAWWRFEAGRGPDDLVFRDVRRFGRLRVVDAGDYRSIPTLHTIGPEPLGPDFTPTQLHAALKRSTRRVKTQLLSQRPVAGVGNIYADEACWIARVRPSARTLSKPQATRLHAAIVEVLTTAVANGGTTLRDYRRTDGREGDNQHHLRCYGRGGLPCARCGAGLRTTTLDARTTTWCARCQR